MSRREVSVYTGLSEGQLRNPKFRGPKARRAGRRILYLKEDVDRWLASLPIDSDPEAA